MPESGKSCKLARPARAGVLPRVRSFKKALRGCGASSWNPCSMDGSFLQEMPPTGAKGLNLAVADVRVLASAMADFYRSGDRAPCDHYSETCLRRVWKIQRFSWWMTSMLHRFDSDNAFDRRRQLGDLDYVTSSRAASQSLAENYVGLPTD